jgi:hypothetical protein
VVTIRHAGFLGIGACVVFWSAVPIFGALRPSYSHAANTISELGALGTPNATLWNLIGFIVPGLLLAVAGGTIAVSVGSKRSRTHTLARHYLLAHKGPFHHVFDFRHRVDHRSAATGRADEAESRLAWLASDQHRVCATRRGWRVHSSRQGAGRPRATNRRCHLLWVVRLLVTEARPAWRQQVNSPRHMTASRKLATASGDERIGDSWHAASD